MIKHEPRHKFDCKRCKFSWACATYENCGLTFAPEPPPEIARELESVRQINEINQEIEHVWFDIYDTHIRGFITPAHIGIKGQTALCGATFEKFQDKPGRFYPQHVIVSEAPEYNRRTNDHSVLAFGVACPECLKISRTRNKKQEMKTPISYVLRSKLKTSETQQGWAVIVNTDLTEGRGFSKVEYVCEKEATARRMAKGIDVRGTDGKVQEVTLYKIENAPYETRTYGPIDLVHPTQEDDKQQKRINDRRAAHTKAKELGLSKEDIAALTWKG